MSPPISQTASDFSFHVLNWARRICSKPSHRSPSKLVRHYRTNFLQVVANREHETGAPTMSTELIFHKELLTDIKTRVRLAQRKAALSANAEMTLMYWDIGRMIAARQGTGRLGSRSDSAARHRSEERTTRGKRVFIKEYRSNDRLLPCLSNFATGRGKIRSIFHNGTGRREFRVFCNFAATRGKIGGSVSVTSRSGVGVASQDFVAGSCKIRAPD